MQASPLIMTLLLSAAAASMTGCSSWARYDLGRMCAAAQEHEQLPFQARQEAVNRAWTRLSLISPRTHELMNAIIDAPPDARYSLVKRAAEQAGRADWECPAMQALLSPEAPERGGADVSAE